MRPEVAGEYRRAGFTVALRDIYIGGALTDVVDRVTASPLYVVVLVPAPSAVDKRARLRGKGGYGDWSVAALCRALRHARASA